MSLVTLTDVVKDFNGVRALDGVGFSVDRGEVVGFLGPNGAGKTTAMRIITHYLEPDSGTVEVAGAPVSDRPREVRRRIGYLPETNPLYPDMLTCEYLDYMGRLRGLSAERRRRRTEEVVARTGLEEVFYRPIEQLSKGYRQRVGLAQAILPEPEILLLDEPTQGLDPNQRVEIRELVRSLGSERTVLLSTHVMQEVQLTCDRVLIIHRGRIIADDSVEALVSGRRRGVRVRVELDAPEAEAREALLSVPNVEGVEPVGRTAGGVGPAPGHAGPAGGPAAAGAGGSRRAAFLVTAGTEGDPRPRIARLAAERGWPLWELHLEEESLEELFRALTAEEDRAASPPSGAAVGPAEAGPAGSAPREAGQETP